MKGVMLVVRAAMVAFALLASGGAWAEAITVWVSPGGSATEPYATQETGCTTLTDALAYLRGLNAQSAFAEAPIVKVDAGTYSDYNHTLDFPVEIRCEGRDVKCSGNYKFFTVNHAKAVVDGIKFLGSKNSCMTISSGVARNCSFSGWSSANAAIVAVSGGRLECSTFGVNVGYGAWKAAGVSVTAGGVVSNCVFNGTKTMETCWFVNGGTIQYSVMTNCQTAAHGHGNLPNNLVIMKSGVIENCIICKSGYTDMYEGSGSSGYAGGSTAFGAVSIHGGTLRNCLIYGNTAKLYPGVGLLGGKMVNCTIGTHGSVSTSATGAGLDLYLKAGAVVNSVVCGNPAASDGGVMKVAGCTAVATNSAFAEGVSVPGYGNRVMSRADFVDAANSNYRLAKASSLRDLCETEFDVFTAASVDLDGKARIQNGKMEPGCFELDPFGDDDVVMRVDLVSSTLNSDYSSENTYGIVLSGGNTSGFSYDWRTNDVSLGSSSQQTVTFRPGVHSLRAIATRGALAITNDIAVSVLGRQIYVSPNGSNTPPYDNWDRAVNNFNGIADVLADGGDAFHEVIVTNASYSVTKSQTLSRNCHVHGFDSRATLTISGGALIIDGEQTEFSDFWIKGSCNGVQVSRGHMHDIEMSDASLGGAPALRVNGGRVSQLHSHGFIGGYSYNQVPVIISGGLLDDFVIEGCTGCESGVIVTGGIVSNGVVRGMSTDANLADNLWQNALSIRGGLVTHCVVTNNGTTTKAHCGTVDISSGTLRNCLIAGNRGRECAGICMVGYNASSAARVVENCTVVVNDGDCPNTARAAYGSCLHMPQGTVRNCVFYTRETKETDKHYIYKTGGTMSNCWVNPGELDPAIVGERIIVGADPCFKTAGAWDYVPAIGSPLIGAGLNQPWMSGAADLAGVRRIRGGNVEIGAFEALINGLKIEVR